MVGKGEATTKFICGPAGLSIKIDYPNSSAGYGGVLSEVVVDQPGLQRPYDLTQLFGGNRSERCHTPEACQHLARSALPHAGNLEQVRGEFAVFAPYAVKGNGEPMGLIADLLDEVERR
jgi:hypothetical protein